MLSCMSDVVFQAAKFAGVPLLRKIALDAMRALLLSSLDAIEQAHVKGGSSASFATAGPPPAERLTPPPLPTPPPLAASEHPDAVPTVSPGPPAPLASVTEVTEIVNQDPSGAPPGLLQTVFGPAHVVSDKSLCTLPYEVHTAGAHAGASSTAHQRSNSSAEQSITAQVESATPRALASHFIKRDADVGTIQPTTDAIERSVGAASVISSGMEGQSADAERISAWAQHLDRLAQRFAASQPMNVPRSASASAHHVCSAPGESALHLESASPATAITRPGTATGFLHGASRSTYSTEVDPSPPGSNPLQGFLAHADHMQGFESSQHSGAAFAGAALSRISSNTASPAPHAATLHGALPACEEDASMPDMVEVATALNAAHMVSMMSTELSQSGVLRRPTSAAGSSNKLQQQQQEQQQQQPSAAPMRSHTSRRSCDAALPLLHCTSRRLQRVATGSSSLSLEVGDERACPICLSNRASVMVRACGHRLCCTCARGIVNADRKAPVCAICRAHIDAFQSCM